MSVLLESNGYDPSVSFSIFFLFDKIRHVMVFAFCNSSLVSTYVVCKRLSVMHQPAGLPEIFDQISPEHP